MFIGLTEVTFTLENLWTALLSLAGIVALVALAVFLFKLVGTIRRINELVSDVKKPLTEGMNKLPSVMENLDTVTGNAVDITDDIAANTSDIMEDATDMTSGLSDAVESLGTLISELSDTLSGLIHSLRHPFRRGRRLATVLKGAKGAVKAVGKTAEFLKKKKTRRRPRKT